MSFASRLLPRLDRIRSIPGQLGLRPHLVTVRARHWSGPGLSGTKTDVDSVLTVGGGQPPKVRRVAYRETVAAGGKYQEGDYRVGPLTPDFEGGGTSFATMTPPRDGKTEVYYIVVGPDTPTAGQPCTAVGIEADHPLHRYLVLRPTGATL